MKKRDTQTAEMFRPTAPTMPEGYYSGDKPNPNLRAFVEAHLLEQEQRGEVKGERLADGTLHFSLSPSDSYDVPAFDKPIETTKATAIYNMHTYWSKKPHDAIRQYVQHYTKPGDLVLDPFCGSGGTALAALMEGCKVIAIDRSPAATFITKNYCTPVDPDALQAAFEELKQKVKPEIDWLYETRCDRCSGKATTAYTVYSQVFQCPRCLGKVPLFDCIEVAGESAKGKSKKINICPHCHKQEHDEEISTSEEKFGSVPVLVSYFCESGCRPVRGQRRHNDPHKKKREFFEKYDLPKIHEIDTKPIPHWYPTDRMMHMEEGKERWGLLWRPYLREVARVDQLYTKRNLWALSTLLDAVLQEPNRSLRDAELFALNSIVLINSRMCDAMNTQISKGTYYLPPVFKEIRPDHSLAGKIGLRINAETQRDLASTDLCISTTSCTVLDSPTNSIDYVFTDPPYSWKVQFGEANFVWESWLRFDNRWHDEEIIVNVVRGKSEADWAAMMQQAMVECYRVLKPGRWLSLCYHDTSEGTWELIQDIMAEAGFVVEQSDQAVFIDATQKSWKQNVADKVTKRDLVINFRKPKPGEWRIPELYIPPDADVQTFRELARQVIREYLQAHPGASKDRIYDELVSRMVRAGQMQSHNFDEILREVGDEVTEPRKKNLFENEDPNLFGSHTISRWYLKESEETALDEAESALEDTAGQIMAAFIKERLEKEPWREGIHYSDLFEHYLYAVKEKPRRQLADWLLDYFYKTPDGTYRLPVDDAEAKAKEDARASGVHRRIKRFLAYLANGSLVPDRERPNAATLADWIRHCKRTGLYDQGKLLYEKGGLNLDHLPEEIAVDVEEDYQVCTRMLSRGEAKGERAKGKGKKGEVKGKRSEPKGTR